MSVAAVALCLIVVVIVAIICKRRNRERVHRNTPSGHENVFDINRSGDEEAQNVDGEVDQETSRVQMSTFVSSFAPAS